MVAGERSRGRELHLETFREPPANRPIELPHCKAAPLQDAPCEFRLQMRLHESRLLSRRTENYVSQKQQVTQAVFPERLEVLRTDL